MKRKIIYLLVSITLISAVLSWPRLKNNKNQDLTINIAPIPEKKVELATLYFPDKSRQYLVKESRVVEYTVGPKEKVILEELIKGSSDTNKSSIIPADVKVFSIDTIDGTVYINLSEEFRSKLEVGRNNEILAIYSIVNSLTALGSIKDVKISVDGDEVGLLQNYMPLDYKYKQNLNIINNPIQTPVEVVETYFKLIKSGEYRYAFDLIYNPSALNVDYSMFYHYQKARDIKDYDIHSFRFVEEDKFATVILDYREITWSNQIFNYRNKEFKLIDYYGEWKIMIEDILDLSQLLSFNQQALSKVC